MKKENFRNEKIFLILLTTVFMVSGCDIVKSVTDKVLNKKEETGVPKESAAKASPTPIVESALPENILAKVGTWSITKDEFTDRLKALTEVVPDFDANDPQSKALVLEELIRQQLFVMDAEATGAAQTKDIKQAVDEFRRTLIVREAAIRLTENIKVSDQEAQEYYNTNKELIVSPFQYKVSEIVLESQEQANAILVEALKGEVAFAELAKQHSKSKSAAGGGDLGFITEEPFPQFANAVLALEAGGISSVFKGPQGFYIVKLTEKTGGEQISFDEVKNDIMQALTAEKQQQAILNKLNELQEKHKVSVNENLL